MNHIAFSVPAERFDDYVARLHLGVETSPVLNHDDPEGQVAPQMHDGVFVRSVYFFDPDGVCLEFAAWTVELGGDAHVRHDPMRADGIKAVGMVITELRA